MEVFGFTTIPAIAVICYLAAEGIKAWGVTKVEWIPVICMILRGILGVTESILNPGSISGDILVAIAVGIASGALATGAHQAIKQLGS